LEVKGINMAVESLFGVSPEALQAQRAEDQRKQAMQFAQMTPGQASQFMAYQAGSGLGSALGGMMGAKDPELERSAQIKSLLQETDMEDLNSVMSTVNRLNKAGFTQQAMALLPRVDKLREAEADRQAKKKDPIKALIASGKYTPSSIAKYEKSGEMTDLVLAEGKNAGKTGDKLTMLNELTKLEQKIADGEELTTVETSRYNQIIALLNQAPVTKVDKDGNIIQVSTGRQLPSALSATSSTGVGGTSGSGGLTVTQTPEGIKNAERAAKSRSQEDILYKNDIANIDKAIEIIDTSGRWAAGVGSWLSVLPETPAAELEQAIGSIDSAKLIQTVMALKGSGPTGATGFGSLTNQEGERLINRINSLKQKQSPDKLKKNLQELKELWAKMHGETIPGKTSESPTTPTSGTVSPDAKRQKNLQLFMENNKSMSREQAINFLKSRGFY
jgi:hypothetical protein